MKSKIFTVLLFLKTIGTIAQVDFKIDSINTIIEFNQNSDYLVVFVHGSGKQDMEGSISLNEFSECEYENYKGFHFKLFNDLSKGMHNEGFSTLRYEKINTRKTSIKNYLVQDFVIDLNKILAEIKKHKILGSKKIILFGWSEGVTVALNQLQFDVEIHGVIGYGGVFIDPIRLKSEVYYQHIMNCEGNRTKAQSFKNQFIEQATSVINIKDEMVNDKIKLVEILYDDKGEIEIGKRTITLPISKAYLKDFQNQVIQTKKLLAETEVPILLLHGQTDINVPFENHEELTNTIQNENVKLVLLQETDHFVRKNFSKNINTRLFQIISLWYKNLEKH